MNARVLTQDFVRRMRGATSVGLIALLAAAALLAACSPTGDGTATEEPQGASLSGTRWLLTAMNGQPPLAGAAPSAEFTESDINGTTGCNSYFGSYTASGGELTFGVLGMTEMYCMDPDGVMDQEQRYLATLALVTGYQMTAERLELSDATGAVVLTFEVDQEPAVGLANPASVYCEEQGYTLEMRSDATGQYGVCILDDGSECEEWALFRGECGPGTGAATPDDEEQPTVDPTRARDAALDYVFDHYGAIVFLPLGAEWTAEDVTEEGIIGASTFQYTAADLVVTVSFPMTNPADMIYQVVVTKEGTSFRWEGQVSATLEVTELAAPTGSVPAVA